MILYYIIHTYKLHCTQAKREPSLKHGESSPAEKRRDRTPKRHCEQQSTGQKSLPATARCTGANLGGDC